MPNLFLKNHQCYDCVGCGACASQCPTKALTMVMDARGFLYPEIDMLKCVNCGICEQACPMHISFEGKEIHKLYAVYHKNEDVLAHSQSGGVFTLLSDWILEQGGAVYGAVIGEDFSVKYARAVSASGRDRMRESKYVQSVLDDEIFTQMKEDCKKGMKVLFSGTPCYTYMAQKMCGKYPNFISLDFICHGVPSPMVWKDYVSVREKQYGPFSKVKFRNQPFLNRGWHSESLYCTNGDIYVSNMYAGIFYSHLAHRESCFRCRFATEKRYSDLTMGGFLDKNPFENKTNYGVSMLFVNSKKGAQVFNAVRQKAHVRRCKVSAKYNNQPCLYSPVKRDKSTDKFWSEYGIMPLEELLEKYIDQKIIDMYHISIRGGGIYKKTKILS